MKILYLDESGDHNLSVIDPNYPIFSLGGIVVDKDYAETEIEAALRAFKRDVLGCEEIILHTADITRNRSGFERLKERGFRERFFQRLNELMSSLRYKVIACVIRKNEHLRAYGVAALDPYHLSFNVLVERFCMEIGNVAGGGRIVAEKRGPSLDQELELAWSSLKLRGTRFANAQAIRKRIVDLTLRDKNDNIAGLQLADLVVSPIGRHVLGKPDREDYKIVSSKFRRSRDGCVEGYGLVVLPPEQIPEKK